MKTNRFRIFGFILSLLFLIMGFFLKSNMFLLIAILNFSISFFYPLFYHKSKIYFIFEILGNYIGRINSFLIIMFLFYFIFTPLSILFKLLQIDLLDKKINKEKKSYFRSRDFPPNSLKKQF